MWRSSHISSAGGVGMTLVRACPRRSVGEYSRRAEVAAKEIESRRAAGSGSARAAAPGRRPHLPGRHRETQKDTEHS
eukprot:COSAG03_NODE_199_length_10789_cov_369.743312_18_plen_77_part_00